MSQYTIIAGELYHYGIKGQKWGVRRYQNPDGTLTNAGKRRQAKREYRNDLKSAISKSKEQGNKYATTYMTARLHRGETYVKNMLGYGAAGGVGLGAVKALKALNKGSDMKIAGRKFVEGAIGGGLGGIIFGALRSKRHINKGELFSESNYGVDPMYNRLNKLGVKPKKSKEYEETVRKTRVDEWNKRAENEQASFDKQVKLLKELKKSGPTGAMMRNMYGDDELTNKKTATKLWKDELDDWNHQANVSKSRVDAYKKASKAVSSMDITNATAKDITRVGESAMNRSFNEDAGRDKKYY